MIDTITSVVTGVYEPPQYGAGVSLASVEGAASPPAAAQSNPCVVVGADVHMIEDHNSIDNERFVNFVQLFLLWHLSDLNVPLPGSATAP